MLNPALHSFACEKAGMEVRIMAGGDDIILQGDDRLNFVDTLCSLGFTPKPQVCPPRRGHFYSAWFVPVQQGMALTPFPGRQLSKLGLSVNGKNTYSESVVSMRAMFAHVPKLAYLLAKLPVQGTAVVRCKPQFSLSPVALLPNSSTSEFYEFIYENFNGIIDDMAKVCDQPSGVYCTVGLKYLLECE
jgi:hypothetical protein